MPVYRNESLYGALISITKNQFAKPFQIENFGSAKRTMLALSRASSIFFVVM
jgi:hypothetical protein